ncbi:kinesin-like protein KIF28 isoform X1 [Branchiostoma lanceolatum]|uniref:kinesin-like protein KIF28 isoform X1 n=1 Tax=Branchiostoma lanceolatum TaxID=7740 RepID=UPI00345553F6
MAENVKVAVRVRPFNDREKARNATLIINMVGNTTTIKDPANLAEEGRKFTFDFSYWSHDGYRERDDGYLEKNSAGSNYADQTIVFEDLGRGVLANAWKGYNCSLFAYGQTGSGKSYSMVGYGNNKGIVPITCEQLFVGIDEKKRNPDAKDVEFQVSVSMLEIYNEQVRDLLNPKTASIKGGLKVRQHPSKGFYVEQLVTAPVSSYDDIDRKINEGTRNRTVAATNMNATSSRAHTIVAINFSQKAPNEAGQSMTKSSVINLVDLAGSERAESTGATGDRLKEGSAINQSLSTLGNVIKALADASSGKGKVMVPFRDSVLTKLLKNALGGNSKTIMIAALSPADINFDETLSTLRFADRAKAIKTKAIVNESPTDKLIRELKEENQKLMDMLKAAQGGGVMPQPMAVEEGEDNKGKFTEEEVEEMKRSMEEQLKRNQEEMETMKMTWEQRLQEEAAQNQEKLQAERRKQEEMKVIPHFWNLNEDPSLTGMVVHFVREGNTRVGNKKASPPADVVLIGLSIQAEHALVRNDNNVVYVKPASADAKVLVNGKPLTTEDGEEELHHNDRVMFGSNHLYVFHHPQDLAKQEKAGKKVERVTYESAQEEIAQNTGFDMDKEGKSKNEMLLQEDLIAMMPMVNEANAMSEELDKKCRFEIALVSPQARGLKEGRTEVSVKMKNLENGNDFMWDRNKFINRKYLMQEMYQNYVEGDANWDVEKDKDPFWEPSDSEVLVGSVHVYLQSLAYLIDLEENLAITDYRGAENGHLEVKIEPCAQDGSLLEDEFAEDPEDLIGNPMHFQLKVPHARGLPKKYVQSCVKYKFYLDEKSTSTNWITGINPDFKHIKQFSYSPVTKQFVEYLNTQPLILEVWGKQTSAADKQRANMSTKQMVAMEKGGLNLNEQNRMAQKRVTTQDDEEKQKLTQEVSLMKKMNEKMDKKLMMIQKLVDEAKTAGSSTLQVEDVDAILSGNFSRKFKGTSGIVKEIKKYEKKKPTPAPLPSTNGPAASNGRGSAPPSNQAAKSAPPSNQAGDVNKSTACTVQ